MRTEWQKCPRCKTKFLKPELINTEPNGYTRFWWVCENSDVCNFPLDMPPHVYHVSQSPKEKLEKVIPLPEIYSLPERYHYLYPTTFVNSRVNSRCSSVLSNCTNSRNETATESPDGTISEKSSGQNRLKADSVHSGTINTPNTPSTSAQTSETADHDLDNIDDEIEAASTTSVIYRTIQRKRSHDPRKSWAALIEKVSADPKAAESIINMEESELFLRMKEFFDDHYFQRNPPTYKRPATRVTYRLDDVENCLRAITREDWRSARRRMPYLTENEQYSMKNSNAHKLLMSVGIDLQAKRKAVAEKVSKVIRGFSTESLTKRRRLEEERKQARIQKEENRKTTIHQSVSARILNKKLKRDEEERSLASTPASFIEDQAPLQSDDFNLGQPQLHQQQQQYQQEPQQVHFHLGNPAEELDQQWGFDLDGLYDDINARNQQDSMNNQDPVEAILSQLNDPEPAEPHELEQQRHENSGDEGDNDDDDFTGFGDNNDFDFRCNSNYDFVNDNFGF